MAKRFPVVLATALLTMLWWQPVAAQPAKARATASVDLNARLQQAQADPQLAQTLLATGRKVAAVCAHCHGEGGNSVKTDIPNLAGQNPAYLLEQLRQFAEGRRRNEFMEGMIKAMDSDEKVGMVLFYAGQSVVHRPATAVALAAKGQAVYAKSCQQCHGTDGQGNAQIARIAGQQPGYLNLTLQRYRDGSSVRANSVMTPSTRQMTPADIQAVVAVVAAMP